MVLSVFLSIVGYSTVPPLARVNGVPITSSHLERFQSKEEPLESAILFELALQQARKEGLDKSDGYQKKAEELLYEAYLEKNAERFSESALQSAYQSQPLFHLYHLRVSTPASVQSVLQELKVGKPFSHVAVRFSQDEDAKTGGRLDYRGPENLPPAVYQALLKSKPNEVLGPLKNGENDFHFVQAIRKLDWKDLPESIRKQWADDFEQKANRSKLKALLHQLRHGAKVEYGPKK